MSVSACPHALLHVRMPGRMPVDMPLTSMPPHLQPSPADLTVTEKASEGTLVGLDQALTRS